MGSLERTVVGAGWYVAWVLWGAPAGVLAAWGLVEFYAEYPSGGYDGGFAGDLLFFGALLSLGQAPFVAFFVWFMLGAGGARSRRQRGAALGVALGWFLAGVFGWTAGSVAEVFVSQPVPLYSDLRVLTGSVRWAALGFAQGFVLAVAMAFGLETDRGGRPAPDRTRGTLFCVVWFSWVAASAVGGLLYEWWESFDLAARSNGTNQAIGEVLARMGVAENVAYVLAPHAIFVPILYGVPTGLAFAVLVTAAMRRSGPPGRPTGRVAASNRSERF